MKAGGGVVVIVVILGCFWDFMEEGVIKFDRVMMLVFDEVDCMLDLGFEFEICVIVGVTRVDR